MPAWKTMWSLVINLENIRLFILMIRPIVVWLKILNRWITITTLMLGASALNIVGDKEGRPSDWAHTKKIQMGNRSRTVNETRWCVSTMIWHKFRRNIGLLIFIIFFLSFLLAYQTTFQQDGSSSLLFSTSYDVHDVINKTNQHWRRHSQSITELTKGDHHASKKCQMTRNIAFIKTHKAGSSTVANILQRFGLAHNLTFALPNRYVNTYAFNYIVKPGEYLTPDKILSLPKGQDYNILWSHSIYNRTAFHLIMPHSTVYISILREPFQQFVSSFEYYNVGKALLKVNSSFGLTDNLVSAFLHSPNFDRYRPKQFGYIRNKQAQDLGFGREEYDKMDKMKSYIDEIDKDFVSVMIMEYFDESLLLLRHKLCWDMKDVLYIPKNKNKNKPNRTFTDDDRAAHKLYSSLDYNLYHHFLEKLKRELQSQSDDFFQELDHFKSLLKRVAENCPSFKPFFVPATRWHSSFYVTLEDCRLMKLTELAALVQLRGQILTQRYKLLEQIHQHP